MPLWTHFLRRTRFGASARLYQREVASTLSNHPASPILKPHVSPQRRVAALNRGDRRVPKYGVRQAGPLRCGTALPSWHPPTTLTGGRRSFGPPRHTHPDRPLSDTDPRCLSVSSHFCKLLLTTGRRSVQRLPIDCPGARSLKVGHCVLFSFTRLNHCMATASSYGQSVTSMRTRAKWGRGAPHRACAALALSTTSR